MGFWETNVGQESHAFTTKVSDDAAADLQRWLGVSGMLPRNRPKGKARYWCERNPIMASNTSGCQ